MVVSLSHTEILNFGLVKLLLVSVMASGVYVQDDKIYNIILSFPPLWLNFC